MLNKEKIILLVMLVSIALVVGFRSIERKRGIRLEDFGYKTFNVSSSTLERFGVPEYPIPKELPSEVMRGFVQWPEIHAISGELDYRVIDPRKKKYLTQEVIREYDPADKILKLFGNPVEQHFDKNQNVTLYQYSKGLIFVIEEEYLKEVLLPRGEPTPDTLAGWKLVFIDESVKVVNGNPSSRH